MPDPVFLYDSVHIVFPPLEIVLGIFSTNSLLVLVFRADAAA